MTWGQILSDQQNMVGQTKMADQDRIFHQSLKVFNIFSISLLHLITVNNTNVSLKKSQDGGVFFFKLSRHLGIFT
jgi:hypothetical protein